MKAFFTFCMMKLISLSFGEGWGEVAAQQDAQYSQYMFNQLALNPAFAGSREVLATSMFFRKQWVGIQGSPTTGDLTVQMPWQKKKIGLGAEIFSDKAGPQNTSALLLSYAYRLRLSKGKLAVGLRMGIYNYVLDGTKMDYRDKNDVYNTGSSTSKFTPTGDFGLYYYSRSFYWGMAFTHLNRGKIIAGSNDSSARQSIHFFMPVGKAFQVGNTVINPTLLIKGAGRAPMEIDISVNVLLKEKVWVGVSGRTTYGFVILTQYQITDRMKAGYSFDYGINKIGISGKGTHEIMVGYDMNFHENKMIMPRYL